MAEATYPLLGRARARRRFRIGVRPRVLAVCVLAAALVALGVALATRTPPVDARAELTGAVAQLKRGNYSAARSQAMRAAAADPSLTGARIVMARAYLALGDGAAAQGALIRVAGAHALKADALLLQGDADAARAEAPAGERIAARATAAKGDLARAQAMLGAILERDPRDAAAWTDLGRIRLTAGEVGGASMAAANAARLAPADPAALTLQGEVVRTRYGLVAALPWFRAALARDAYYPPALAEAAATLGDLGRNTEALAATRALLAARPGDARALYLQAVMAARAGETGLARRLIQAAGAAVWALPGAQLLDGALDYRDGRYEQAAIKWRRLAEDQPLSVSVRRLLAAALLRSGDAGGALAAIGPIVARGDADAYALTLAAQALAMRGDTGGAARMTDRAARPGGVAAPFASDASIGALRAGAASAPGDPSYALGVIRGLMGQGDGAGAVAAARALVAATPGAPPAQLALGDALSGAGRWGEAATVYARAADLDFDEPTMLRLIDALGRAGRRADAARALALYLAQHPQSVTARRLLAAWQVEGGLFPAAIETLEGLRHQIGNRDAALLAMLAVAYAGADDGDGGGEVAVRYGRAAYRLQPMSAQVADAYGVALAAAGELAAARQLLDKAVALAPGDAAIAAHRRRLG